MAHHEQNGGLESYAVHTTNQRVCELRSGEGHRKRRRTSTVLRFDDFVTAKLDAVSQGLNLVLSERMTGLGQQGYNGDARVAADDGDLGFGAISILELGDEARSTDNIEGGHAEEALGIEDTVEFQDLGNNRDG
ncbi:hypothetical protein BC936DRAFT_137684 [Jimgerdemannia flammicorona]|uniref:Uncharacterized protein n=1 Tax=Jimgerdemannia flammicorona TaxID=994334 RepID=A0A433DIU8_9FUNG|nr:hypothetical protein BC936DRAFT_137684 [Jimgerdemannia flammicorona]